MYAMPPKIFFIGFNKCRTTSLHNWLIAAGVKSFHGATALKCEIEMLAHAAMGNPILTGIDQYDAYLDIGAVQQLFREIDAAYPGSRFVLNTRPVDRWLLSRLNHMNGTYVTFMNLYYKTNLSPAEWVDRWRREFAEHEAAVRDHFQRSKSPYLRFDVEADRPATLAAFLEIEAPDEFPRANMTKQRRFERLPTPSTSSGCAEL